MSTKKLFGIFSIVVITALSTYFFLYLLNDNSKQNEQTDIPNSFDLMEINTESNQIAFPLFGISTYTTTQEVRLKVNGTIDQKNRSLSVGQKVKKNEIIIKVDRLAVLYEILEKRTAFKNQILDLLPRIAEEVPSEKDKWDNYVKDIQRTSSIPTIPKISTKEESELIDQTLLLQTYYNLKKIELEAENYFYSAPFDGVIVSSKVAPGSMINKNIPLLVIAKKGTMAVKTNLSIDQASLLSVDETYFFLDSERDTVGVGHFDSNDAILSDSSTVISTFSIQLKNEILPGEQLKIVPSKIISSQQITIPKSAVKEKSVLIYVDTSIVKLPIQIISENKDSVIVTGFQGHCYLITNPI